LVFMRLFFDLDLVLCRLVPTGDSNG